MTSDEKIRVLVVDDDPGIHKMVSILLQRAGMSPVGATNATEAAQVLRQRPLPDIIVLDLMLPDISGIDFLKQMREKTMFDHLPVVILSAMADPAQIREGLEAGADRYLTKPYLANNLISTLHEVLKSGRRTT